MYKIHINETPLLLLEPQEAAQYVPSEAHLIARYTGKPKHILQYVDLLEKNRRFQQVILYYDTLDQLWNDFQSHFERVEAAGGVVRNPDGQVLVIFRRGFWDLPKGKIDAGESPEEAAVREVKEETGLNQVVRQDLLMPTYHTYREKGRRILKCTHWYGMDSTQEELKPQAEENIELAEWRMPGPFLADHPRMHANVEELLHFSIDKKFLT